MGYVEPARPIFQYYHFYLKVISNVEQIFFPFFTHKKGKMKH